MFYGNATSSNTFKINVSNINPQIISEEDDDEEIVTVSGASNTNRFKIMHPTWLFIIEIVSVLTMIAVIINNVLR